ncbi:MAG: helix-turn-helix domain-containing protein [Planctomycetales bacterium]|nr:helix-turn-helix domain-containing protein [Planctomycetales bacterium]
MMYTVSQVAEKLNVSPKTVYALLRQGLEHYRVGNAIRIDDRQIQMYLDAQKIREDSAPTPPPRKQAPKLKHLRID